MVKLDEATSIQHNQKDAGAKFRGLDIAAGGGAPPEPLFLWVVDDSLDDVFKRDAEDISAVSSWSAPTSSAYGITFEGTDLWLSQAGDGSIKRMDFAGTVLDSIPGSTNIRGLAWDGEFLWATDRGTDTVDRIDPADGTILESHAVPGADPRGLTWDGSALWFSDYGTNLIYQMDPADGTILNSFTRPGLDQATGLTWGGDYLWVASRTGSFFKVDPSDGSILFNSGDTTLWPADITGTTE